MSLFNALQVNENFNKTFLVTDSSYSEKVPSEKIPSVQYVIN